MKTLLTLVSTLTLFSASAQLPADTILPSNFNKALVNQLFIKELNDLRRSKSAEVLMNDETLNKAAQDQSDYCMKANLVTHFQRDNTKKYDPAARVKYYAGNHRQVGENVQMVVLFQPIVDKDKKIKAIYTYGQLAHQLFENWKNSPGHYQNMITRSYTRSGFAMSLYSNNKVLYAAQVFGSEPYVAPKNGLSYSDTTWNVKEYEDGKCKSYGVNEYLTQIFSSYLFVKEDSVFQYFMRESRLKEMIKDPGDGIAIDLVCKDQFVCLQPDKLHPSTVFDGYMFKPKYRDELFKNDQYADAEFLSFLCKIPPNAPQTDYQLNTILIQNGRACRYSYPITVEDGILPDISVVPQWCIREGVLRNSSADMVKDYFIPFAKNEKTSEDYFFDKLKRVLSVFDGVITSIEITSYSSVEGNEVNNLELQTSRGDFIQKFIERNLVQPVKVKRGALENWELFSAQLKGSAYEPLFGDTTREGLRKEVNKRMNEPIIENWLYQQRIAKIRLHVHNDYDNDIPDKYLPIAIYDGLAKADTLQAQIAYSRLIKAYQRGELGKQYLTAIEVPLQKENLPVISNYLAAILLESDVFGYSEFNMAYYSYIDSAKRMFSDFKPLAFNLCVFKAHLYFRSMLDDITGFKKLQEEILKFKAEPSVEQTNFDHLMFNYYLTASLFYRDMHRYEEMYNAFDAVIPYLPLAALSKEEVYAVGKYYNYFFRFEETIELLETYLNKFPTDENLVYLYVSTGAIYNLNIDYHTEQFYKELDLLAKMNRGRLCKWFNENFQLMRNEAFEQKICSYCQLR